jgi:UDP-N-acetylmuramate--alanine ligase
VHFIGISGIGMSALARILLQRGVRVSGSSDRRTALTDRLIEEGAAVSIGHAAANLAAAQTVVVSSAIAQDNPELRAAREQGLEIVHRGELLARMMRERRGLAVAGTHGKTTTSAMLARVLEAGGLDPASIIGGERVDTGSNARDGAGEWLVGEADESDYSFLDLQPQIAVVTNVENDHVASDAEMTRMSAAFERFLAQLPVEGLALVGADEPHAAALAKLPRRCRTQTFGHSPQAWLRALAPSYEGFGSRFGVALGGAALGEVRLAVPGAINVFDALPSVAIGLELGLPFATIAQALEGFRGVRRRFEILARTARMTVVDDYAHHPTAIAATIAAARPNAGGPLVVVFQPHRYTRTQYLGGEFARALRGADEVVLTDVYAASERPIPGIDARTIGAPLEAAGTRVGYVPNVDDVPEHLLDHAPEGALVLMLGAGSISGAAARLARELGTREAALR